jgi:NADH-quinone oxidoreductase subunit C
MTINEIHERLQSEFGEAVGPLSEPKVDPFCFVKPEKLVEICRFLKRTPGIEMDFCEDVAGVDYPKRNVIEVVYHLYSYNQRHGIVLKVETDRAKPVAPSIEGVWKAANWMEREIFDILGVTFTGHPDLRRILLPDDWVGHPLRKDYQEAGGYHGISNERENPLVELKRLDDKRRAEIAAANPPPPPPPPAAPPAAPADGAPAKA